VSSLEATVQRES